MIADFEGFCLFFLIFSPGAFELSLLTSSLNPISEPLSSVGSIFLIAVFASLLHLIVWAHVKTCYLLITQHSCKTVLPPLSTA